MSLKRPRRTAAIAVLAATFLFAAPVHAATWQGLTVTPGWVGEALQWLAGLWTGNATAAEAKPARMKSSTANGSAHATAPGGSDTMSSDPEIGYGIDPDGA